jgi:proline dehydrogenase
MFNKLVAALLPFMPKKLVWIFSKKYIAGETLQDAVESSKELNENGMLVTIDVLGEFIKDLDEAEANKEEYLEVIEAAEKNNIQGNFSIKPTFFGLLLDEEVCYNHVREVVAKAASYNNFVRIDMEDSPCTDKEIRLFRRVKEEFPTNVGLVFQAYMKRTLDDVKGLMDIHKEEAPLNFRLCKGIYVEPPEIAYKGYDNINKHFIEDMEYMLKNGIYVGIATHDRPIIDAAYDLIEKYNVPKDKYEFQMLYGVTPNLRQEILDKGHKMRVYVPFGDKWFGYSTRRLKENPKMAEHIIKALFIKK